MGKRKTVAAMLTALLALSVCFTGCQSNKNTDGNSDASDTQSEQNSSSTLGDDSPNTGSNVEDSNTFSITDTIEDVYTDLMGGAEDWLDKLDQSTMETAYQMDFSNMEEVYGRIPQANVHATSVIGVRVKEGKTEEAKAELMKYQAALSDNFDQYLPDQYEMVQDYRMIEEGDYLFLVIAENADEVEQRLRDAVR